MLGGVSYDKVDDEGLHITVGGEARVLDVDHVVVCAGQEPLKDLEVLICCSCFVFCCCLPIIDFSSSASSTSASQT